ncbi:hypothetical protein [Pseudomonas citronellolis]|uniref:hypothetical protein n=1 Tax=Pseudomonas citronellolis TaxID=53408 RepID=UPI0023E4502D|nr:hypothetical protein [Pseudomonas citronellolis]MDF3932710.1 hypothetical protein [Pseudomonas citronellolis]
MKLQLIASAILATATLFAAQASFAEESSLMQNRMVNLSQAAMQHQADQTAQHQQDAAKAGHQG